jgi:hypothetical protein
MNNIKLIWNGSFMGIIYSLEINGKYHKLSGETELEAKADAEQWLFAHGIYTDEFDVWNSTFEYGGCL